MPIPIIGHRGCPLYAPENSLAGIRKAAELGADGVEIDIRRALDGVPVVFHDWSLRRMTGLPGPVQLYPSFLLRRLRLRGSDERIPLLADVLDALPDGLFLAIELKDAGAARPTLRLVRERGMERRVRFWSNQDRAIRYLAREAAEIETTLLRDDTDPEGLERFLKDADQMGARGISPHWDAVNPQLAGEAHDRGLQVYAMNRDLETVAKKVAAGLDGIITDHPREVRAILENAAGR
jgi:glycerophosphoryl diester phosphodiesterase